MRSLPTEYHPIPARARRWIFKIGFWLASLFLFAGLTTVLIRLSEMRLDGFGAAGLALLAVSFSFASLLYNRARAHPSGPTQRRALCAAEFATRANVWFVVTLVYGAAAYTALHEFGYRPPAQSCFLVRKCAVQADYAPLILAMPVIVLLIFAIQEFFAALKICLSKGISFFFVRPFVRQNRRQNR